MMPARVGDVVHRTKSTPASKVVTPILLHPSLVTADFDPLRFQAAASAQLLLSSSSSKLPRSTNLIASPYNTPPHHLDLTTLQPIHSIFARALTLLKPIQSDYATADYMISFNWDEVLAKVRHLSIQEGFTERELEGQEFYTVVFRSKLREDVDKNLLHVLDEQSHAEAVVSGGLLKYWFGSVDGERRNLATCIWRSREDAHLGGLGPWHKKARMAARTMYEYIDFSTWRLVIGEGAKAIRLEPWVDTAKGSVVPQVSNHHRYQLSSSATLVAA